MTLSQLYIYPVKSLAGISLSESEVELRGLKHDRRWMIVDEDGRFMTQREKAEMALIGTAVSGDGLRLFQRNAPESSILIPLMTEDSLHPRLKVQVWGDSCAGYACGLEADTWLSNYLKQPVRLVYMPDTVKRHTDTRYAPKGQYVSYADGFPFLIIGEASLEDLNGRLDEPVPMNRFRPNFVFSGGKAFEEDEWSDFSIGGVEFRGVKPCGRCVMTTIDQEKATRLVEPIKTLASYRMRDKSIKFGQNVIYLGDGSARVRVGDQIRISVS